MKFERKLNRKDVIDLMLDPEAFYRGELNRLEIYLIKEGYVNPSKRHWVFEGRLIVDARKRKVSAVLNEVSKKESDDILADFNYNKDAGCYEMHLLMPGLEDDQLNRIRHHKHDGTLTVYAGDYVKMMKIPDDIREILSKTYKNGVLTLRMT